MSRFLFADERLRYWAAQTPGNTAITSSSGKRWSFAELERAVDEHAREVRSLKLERGELVTILLPHTPETAIRILALMREGLTGVVVESREKPEEVERRLAALPSSAVWSRDSLKIDPRRSLQAKEEIDRLGACWILQTSGSGGDAKAVLMDDKNLSSRARGETAAFALETGGSLLNILTFAHDLGLNQLLTALDTGSALHMVSMVSVAEIARRMKEAGAPGVTGTPHLWREFLSMVREGVSAEGLEPRYLTVSGGAMDARALNELREFFPKSRVIRTYGQTETFRTLIDGFPIAGVTAELSAAGELIHRGPGEMLGYLLDPGASALKRVPGGGIATGDLFERAPDGELIFKGRHDDLIKRDDFRISLFEIESELRGCPAVADAAVVEVDGDLIAFVTTRQGERVDRTEVFLRLRDRMSRYKVPDSLVVVDRMPRTAVGKVSKPELKKRWLETGS